METTSSEQTENCTWFPEVACQYPAALCGTSEGASALFLRRSTPELIEKMPDLSIHCPFLHVWSQISKDYWSLRFRSRHLHGWQSGGEWRSALTIVQVASNRHWLPRTSVCTCMELYCSWTRNIEGQTLLFSPKGHDGGTDQISEGSSSKNKISYQGRRCYTTHFILIYKCWLFSLKQRIPDFYETRRYSWRKVGKSPEEIWREGN